MPSSVGVDSRGPDWTDQELRAAVRAYVKMRRMEQAGGDYSKADFQRELRAGPLSRRSNDSVRRRMQNISAVMQDLGQRWIVGYTPMPHVGEGVKARIRRELARFGIARNRPARGRRRSQNSPKVRGQPGRARLPKTRSAPAKTRARGWLYQSPVLAREVRTWNKRIESEAPVNGREMSAGDALFYWNSGPLAGIYAIGEVAGRPVPKKSRAVAADRPRTRHRIPSRIVNKFTASPVLRSELLRHPVLKHLDVIRRPWGANFFRVTAAQVDALRPLVQKAIRGDGKADKNGALEPPDNDEERQLQARRVRRGQARLRARLREEYHDRCAILGSGPPQVLDACHIRPHAVKGENDSRNGLLLRTDLHTLFDLRLLRINPSTLRVAIDSSLKGTPYWWLNRHGLRQRKDGQRPNKAALNEAWVQEMRAE